MRSALSLPTEGNPVKAGLVIALGAALGLSSGCAFFRPAAAPLCGAEVKEPQLGSTQASTWFALLLHSYDPVTGRATRPALDCGGTPVLWLEPEEDECAETGPKAEPLKPPDRLDDGDVVLEKAGDDKKGLVWIITRRYTNGEGVGPLGLVEQTDKGFAVRALGTLRAQTLRPKLRLEKVGGADVLVAEGDTCASGVCRRELRVLPLRKDRFFSEAVTTREGACLGPAWFPLSREEVFELPNGNRRKLELTTAITFGAEQIGLHEQVVVSEQDPRQPNVPPRVTRRVQADRSLQVGDRRLVASAPSLWVGVMEQQKTAGGKALEPAPADNLPGERPRQEAPAQTTSL